MNKIDIDGNVLDSFHISYHDKWGIDLNHISMRVEQELYERLNVYRKLKKNYAVYVVIAEIEGDRDAISQRKESQKQERFLHQRQA